MHNDVQTNVTNQNPKSSELSAAEQQQKGSELSAAEQQQKGQAGFLIPCWVPLFDDCCDF